MIRTVGNSTVGSPLPLLSPMPSGNVGRLPRDHQTATRGKSVDRLGALGTSLLKHPEVHLSGMGNQIISVPARDLRRLGQELPPKVEIIRSIIPTINENPCLLPDEDNLAYLHIRHVFCFRTPPRGMMCIEPFDEFLARYAQLESRYGPMPKS